MPDLDRGRLETRVAEVLTWHACVGLAVGVVHEGALQFCSGYGVGFPPGRVPPPAQYYRGRVRLDVEPGATGCSAEARGR